MKKYILSILFIALIACSFLSGMFFQDIKAQNKIEDIVSNEVAISLKHQNYPSCKEVISIQNQYVSKNINDSLIIWRYWSETQILQKVIIDNSFNVVSEELKVNNPGTDKCIITCK
jgi:hypothetical protein